MSTTRDGYTVTHYVQDGPCVGMPSKRLWVRRTDRQGWEWWECDSTREAKEFAADAPNLTRAELVAELNSGERR